MSVADDVRRLALALPEVEESPHFESASFRVRGKILATLGAGGVTLKLPPQIQEALLQSHPGAVTLPAHWGRHGWTQLRLEAFATDLLADLIATAWRQVAPRALIAKSAP